MKSEDRGARTQWRGQECEACWHPRWAHSVLAESCDVRDCPCQKFWTDEEADE